MDLCENIILYLEPCIRISNLVVTYTTWTPWSECIKYRTSKCVTGCTGTRVEGTSCSSSTLQPSSK